MLSDFFRTDVTTPVDCQIDAVLNEMETIGVNSDRYPVQMTYLERLHELKTKTRQPSVSRDTLIVVAGNLVGILLVVAYEQKHVITSKAFGQLVRPK